MAPQACTISCCGLEGSQNDTTILDIRNIDLDDENGAISIKIKGGY